MKFYPGDIVWVNFPFTDGSSSKIRPALVLSNTKVNKTGDYLLMQITSQLKNDDLSLRINTQHYRHKPLLIDSYLRLFKVFAINHSLIIRKETALKKDFRLKIVKKFTKLIL